MTKRKNSRYIKRDSAIDPYKNLVADIIKDAVLIAPGEVDANEKVYAEAIHFLRSEKCKRWAGALGINWRETINHKKSLIREVVNEQTPN